MIPTMPFCFRDGRCSCPPERRLAAGPAGEIVTGAALSAAYGIAIEVLTVAAPHGSGGAQVLHTLVS